MFRHLAEAGDAPIDCNSMYVVGKGDNLSSIAERAYGRRSLAQYLYEVNKENSVDPSELTTGTKLSIPCLSERDAPAASPGSDEAEINQQDNETRTLTNDPGPSAAQ